jgi:type VI secretion system secreted protein VgrG
VTNFRRLAGSRDQVTYEIILEPFISLLDKQFRTHRFFVNKSVPEVVEQILGEHGLKRWEYEFKLKQTYPKREQINQYQESDLAFIERLLAEVGIFTSSPCSLILRPKWCTSPTSRVPGRLVRNCPEQSVRGE